MRSAAHLTCWEGFFLTEKLKRWPDFLLSVLVGVEFLLSRVNCRGYRVAGRAPITQLGGMLRFSWARRAEFPINSVALWLRG